MNPYSSNYDYQGAYQNAQNQYQQAAGNTAAAQNNLSSYRQNMEDPSKMYGDFLGQAQKMYGFDPTQLLKANQNLSNTQTTLANLPQIAQQQGNYYGTTAGAMGNNYSQMAGNLNGLLAGQSNAVNAYRDVLGATQNQANQQATLGYQGEQLNLDALNKLLQGSLTAQQSAQGQEGVAQSQMSNYGSYLNAAKQAAAAQTAAGAQAQMANAQSSQIQQQIQQLNAIQNAFKSLYGNNWAAALSQLTNGQPINLPASGTSGNAISLGAAPNNGSTPGNLQGGSLRLQP